MTDYSFLMLICAFLAGGAFGALAILAGLKLL